jgi:transposase InsO family protein
MCHVGWNKVYKALKKQFHWENMHTMVKKEVLSCRLCALLKAKMSLAHKHFRAKLFCTPRTSYGADYYGVRMNEDGFCAILGIIDLATGDLILRAAKSACGAHVAHTLFHDVVMRKGVPLLFHTDAAAAFLGKAVSSLASVLGIKRTDTLAHNPKSNAKMERVWEFVGRCLRAMPSEQYAQFPKMLPIMEHVWSDTIDSETGVTPFEAEHGMPMRSVAEALLANPPPEGLPAGIDDLHTIAQSAHAYAEHLANVKAVEKSVAANRLNAKGFSKHEYSIGERVSFYYLPPTVKQAQVMGKNPKHMLHFVGPAEIVESLSDHGTSWRLEWNGSHYRRNIMHMEPYRPDDYVQHQQRAVVDNTVYLNSYVAVLDNDDDGNYHVAKVIGLNANQTKLHYMGTASKTLRSAKWRLMYHRLDGEGYQWYNPNTITRRHEPLTGMIDTRPREDSLIILPNLGFNEHMQFNKDTATILKTYQQKHHVYGRTWH